MIRALPRLAILFTFSSAVAACFGNSDKKGPPIESLVAGDGGGLEAGTTPMDATVEAAPGREAGSGTEAGPIDATVAEAGTVIDGAALDDSPVAPPLEAGPDVSPIPVAGCIPDVPGGHYIFGDHYLRSDGELFYAPNGTHTLVVNANTGLALLGVTEVAQQADHACGLVNDGTVWCWPLFTTGGNTDGDLGNGSIGGTNLGIGMATQVVTSLPEAGTPTYLAGAIHLSGASDTQYTFPTCAILSDHTLWCWGYGSSNAGMLFSGTTGNANDVPVATPIAASASDGGPPPTVLADQVSVGFRHACVLRTGTVSCWGLNVAGNLGTGDTVAQPYPVPVQTGIGLPATVDEIGCGFDFSCARAGGGVWCWGTSNDNEEGNPGVALTICNSNYCIPVPAPVQQSTGDGGLTSFPDAGTNQSPLVGATSLYVGYLFACILDSSNTIWCWGAANAGVTTVPEAVPYTSASQPYTDVNEVTIYGEDPGTALRYLTASGHYISGNREFTPFCQ